ncbi:MAG TPA: isoprenyl transferase [bacterium]|nr:isoprenyl transferase [bacterium]
MRAVEHTVPEDLAQREDALRASLDPSRIPRHIAIIMDGNGRWAEIRGRSRAEGHRAGREALRRTLEAARECGVECLTLYAFSTENWRRPPEEVQALMDLLIETLAQEAEELHQNGVQLRASGLLGEMPVLVRAALDRVMALTRTNTTITLNLALNYGSRRELTEAARRLAQAAADGRLRPDEITEDAVARCLYAPDLPDPDLLIRTGGEQRLSNFLLWQAAYAELYFTDIYWPDFQKAHLFEAIKAFQGRDRRFGGVELG